MDPTLPSIPGLTVVIPALNAADRIAGTIDRLDRALAGSASSIEYIVVDDGSTDGTGERVLEIAQLRPGVRVLRNRRRLGKGLALHLGVYAASHPALLLTDADGPFSDESYQRVVAALAADTPLAIASRRMPESQLLIKLSVLGYASRRHFVGIVFNRLARMLTGLPYRDTQCGLKALDRATALELFSHVRLGGFLFDIEVLLAAQDRALNVAEVPVCVEFEDKDSSISVAVDSLHMALGLIRVVLRRRPAPADELLGDRRFAELTEELKPQPVADETRAEATTANS